MRSGALARGRARVRARALTFTAGAILMVAVAGCAAAGTRAVTVPGRTLTIYTSAPVATAGAGDPVVQDVLDAEQLAFNAKAGEVTAFRLTLQHLASAKLSTGARAAIQNPGAIAYLGEIQPGRSADTLGITNAQDLLQVSPTDTALELTQASPAIPSTPGRYYESLKTYGRTFARVVPTTAHEARAQVQEMRALGVHALYLTNDGTPYGRALAAAVRAAASGVTVTVGEPSAGKFGASGADALLLASGSPTVARGLFNAAAIARPGAKLFAPSALADPAFATSLGAAKLNLYVSTPGFLSRNLPAAARSFVSSFQAAYHRAPGPQAIFGYEAMAAVIDVLKQAGGSANDRSTVVKGFFAIRNRAASVLGPYSIDANGDTSAAPFVFGRLRAGQLVPFAQVLG